MVLRKIVVFAFLTFSSFFLYGQDYVEISTDFPGGNIIVENCVNRSTLYYHVRLDTVNLRPDLRDTEGEWFYWYFKVSGAENRAMFFQFPDDYVGNFGPAFSIDGGGSWQWLYKNSRKGQDHFSFTFSSDENQVLFCMGIPYLQKDFEKFISPFNDNPYVTLKTFTTSEKGRDVEELNIKHPKKDPKYRVLITARHHACEMMANYVLEGIIESVLNGKDSDMKWLRDNVEFLVIPFMDKDGVEDGDQGKNRKPRDHNRDYSGKSIYKSTSAMREKIPDWSEGLLKVALDLHCPYITGEWHENIYIVGSGEENLAWGQKQFIETLIMNQEGQLKMLPANICLEYGTAWNTSNNNIKGWGFSKWASTIGGISVALSMEIPYSNHNGQNVTSQNARLVGKDLATAMAIYLQRK